MSLKSFVIICLGIFIQLPIIAQTYWSLQTSGTSNILWSVNAVDSNVVWACGESRTVLRTINGGINWNLTNAPNNDLECYSIEAINADTAWVISADELGGNTAISKTIDGGVSWQVQHSSNSPASFYNAVRFYDNDHGIFIGDPEDGYFAIYTTENGGETWTRTESTNIPEPDGNDEYGITDNLVIFGNKAWFATQNAYGKNPKVFYSNDRGESWSAITIIEGTSISTIAFSNELIGIMVCDLNKVYYTRDGGLTWIFSNNIPLLGYSASPATSSSFVLVGGSSFVSTDGGATWDERETNYTNSLEVVSFANSSNGWAAAYNGDILKWIGGSLPDDSLTSIEEFGNNIPSGFELKQNYPNPFNPSTKLSYKIIQSGLVTLKIFDVLGIEIETLVNEEKSIGTYELNWNAVNLPSGVYFYQLRISDFVETKNMILLR